jgi:hypothetical protein
MTYGGKQHQLYLLLRQDHEYHWILYDVKQNNLATINEDELLELIQCSPETPLANVPADDIEQAAQLGRALWSKKSPASDQIDAERVCALYLLPEVDSQEFADMLRSGLSN